MSKKFDDLMGRVTCQMRVMLKERRKFNVLAKELRVFTKGRRGNERNTDRQRVSRIYQSGKV